MPEPTLDELLDELASGQGARQSLIKVLSDWVVKHSTFEKDGKFSPMDFMNITGFLFALKGTRKEPVETRPDHTDLSHAREYTDIADNGEKT